MTKAANKTAQGYEESFPFPQFEMTAFNGNLFSAYAQASQAFFDSAMALNQEIMRFANERIQADSKALEDITKCTNWENAVTLQTDFARSAAEAYQAEISKLIEQSTEAATAAWKPFQDSTKVLAEGTPPK